MAEFITRVELHGATGADYEKLHQEMQARGFTRTVIAHDGTRYMLPTAEYHCVTARSVDQVRDLAKQAALTTGHSSWIFASEYTQASWELPAL